jgi:hypothetical protein
MKVLRTHLVELQTAGQSSAPCSSSQIPSATIDKVQSIAKQFQLLSDLQAAATQQNHEQLQIVLVQLREECPHGIGEILIKKIYQHTRNLHRQLGKVKQVERYGCKAFLNIEKCTTTSEEKIEIIHRARATLLLPVIKSAIQQNQLSHLEQYLSLIKQIHLRVRSGKLQASLETYLYRHVWLEGGRPPRDPLIYGHSALINATPLDQVQKINAVDKTIDALKKYING